MHGQQQHRQQQLDWYWCLEHDTVELGLGCPARNRLGPYPSEQAALNWRDVNAAREDRWEEQDKAWRGEQD